MNNKKRLFEVMTYINPEIKLINENEDENLTADVRYINNVKTAALKTAQSRINTQQEFNDAFTKWFGDLGVSTEKYKDKIRIATSINHIRDVLEKNGIIN